MQGSFSKRFWTQPQRLHSPYTQAAKGEMQFHRWNSCSRASVDQTYRRKYLQFLLAMNSPYLIQMLARTSPSGVCLGFGGIPEHVEHSVSSLTCATQSAWTMKWQRFWSIWKTASSSQLLDLVRLVCQMRSCWNSRTICNAWPKSAMETSENTWSFFRLAAEGWEPVHPCLQCLHLRMKKIRKVRLPESTSRTGYNRCKCKTPWACEQLVIVCKLLTGLIFLAFTVKLESLSISILGLMNPGLPGNDSDRG